MASAVTWTVTWTVTWKGAVGCHTAGSCGVFWYDAQWGASRAEGAHTMRVVATARKAPDPPFTGAEFRSLDLLDNAQVLATVADVRPDGIVHQATALTGISNNLRRFDRTFATTNRLRTEGTASLVQAATALPSPPRLVVQSFCGWPWAPTGGPVKSEDDQLDPHPAPAFRRTFAALQQLEEIVNSYAEGVALRYGALYGPGTSLTDGGAQIKAIKARQLPLVGDAKAIWSFLHVGDAADAAVAALEHGHATYNVADDDPVTVREWLVEVARLTGSPPPRRVPVWLARAIGGQGLVHLMTSARGASNRKAKAELGWSPAHPSWRAGFAADLVG